MEEIIPHNPLNCSVINCSVSFFNPKNAILNILLIKMTTYGITLIQFASFNLFSPVCSCTNLGVYFISGCRLHTSTRSIQCRQLGSLRLHNRWSEVSKLCILPPKYPALIRTELYKYGSGGKKS